MRSLLFAAAVAVATFAAPDLAEARPVLTVSTPSATLVRPARPAPRTVAVRPLRPTTAHVWVQGQWMWTGYAWTWQAGYWAAPARPSPPIVMYSQPAPRTTVVAHTPRGRTVVVRR